MLNRILTCQAENSKVKQGWALQENNVIKCINNSFDAHRTASASFVFNKPNPQINRVLTDIEALVSHYVALNRTPSWPENHPSFEQSAQGMRAWAREALGCYGVCTCLSHSIQSILNSQHRSVSAGEGWWSGWWDSIGPGPLRPPAPCF